MLRSLAFRLARSTRPRFASTVDTSVQRFQQSLAQGITKINNGEFHSALGDFSHALSLNPHSADAHYNLGICEYSLGNINRALEHWERSISIDPKKPDAYVNAGNVYFMNKGDKAKAIDLIKRAVEIDPSDAQVRYNLGCMYEDIGELQMAVEEYKAAAKDGIEKAKVNLRNALAKLSKK